MTTSRLFIDTSLSLHHRVSISDKQHHYLHNVMRLRKGNKLLVFNGKDGEWEGEIETQTKRDTTVLINRQTRPQSPTPYVRLCFALVKQAPLANISQKATELGVTHLQPVMTQRTNSDRFNSERFRLQTIEAAEQSLRLDLPEILPPAPLEVLLEEWSDHTENLLYCDESGGSPPFLQALPHLTSGKVSILIGPEGGFSKSEFDILQHAPYSIGAGLGPRVLRADTAAIAALTCYQSQLGDWHERPNFTPE